MTRDELRSNISAYIAGLSMGGNNETVTSAIMNDVALFAAPQKPAPDAMREALTDIGRQKTIPELIEDGNEVGDLEYAYNMIIARARQALSATVPPPDGADKWKWKIAHDLQNYSNWTILSDDTRELFERAIRALSPSPGAAEPSPFVQALNEIVSDANAGVIRDTGAAEPDDVLRQNADRAHDKLYGFSPEDANVPDVHSGTSAPPDDVRSALARLVEMDDDAREAHGKPGTNLNGLGLVDLFDCVGHPFGTGEHKQQPYRSNQLEVALTDARAALRSAPVSAAVLDAEISRWENDTRVLYPDNEVLESLSRINAAAPPARDREALERIAEFCSGDNSTLGAVARLAEVRRIADAALLSLPVQSTPAVGATREAIDIEDAKSILEEIDINKKIGADHAFSEYNIATIAAALRLALSPAPDATVSARDAVIEEIATERRRQIEVEGYDTAHDDEHTKGEIARAAACYAHIAGAENDWLRNELIKEWWGPRHSTLRAIWPWDWSYFKPRTRRCDLIRSCAMNIAEIERIDRSLAQGAKP